MEKLKRYTVTTFKNKSDDGLFVLYDDVEEMEAELETLRKEAFSLSAVFCEHAVGDEHAHLTCKYRDRLDKIYKLLLKFIKESVESPAVTPEEANLQQAMVMIMIGNIISPGMEKE